MRNHRIRFSRVSVPKPIFIALILISVISTSIAIAVVTQWPLTLRMRVGGTDFTVHELNDDLIRIGEAHEHDFGVLTTGDSCSWLIEIENLSPYSIWINYTLVDLPANFTVELMYDYSGFDMQDEWTEGVQLQLESAGEYQDVIVIITLYNQDAEAGTYSFQIVIQAA